MVHLIAGRWRLPAGRRVVWRKSGPVGRDGRRWGRRSNNERAGSTRDGGGVDGPGGGWSLRAWWAWRRSCGRQVRQGRSTRWGWGWGGLLRHIQVTPAAVCTAVRLCCRRRCEPGRSERATPLQGIGHMFERLDGARLRWNGAARGRPRGAGRGSWTATGARLPMMMASWLRSVLSIRYALPAGLKVVTSVVAVAPVGVVLVSTAVRRLRRCRVLGVR